MARITKKSKDLRRRHQRVRQNVTGTGDCPRLAVFRSLRHIYAQLIDDIKGQTLAAVSTKSPDFPKDKSGGNIDAATIVGGLLAEKAKSQSIESVVFDRGGRRYHGRVKALADAARKGGLKF